MSPTTSPTTAPRGDGRERHRTVLCGSIEDCEDSVQALTREKTREAAKLPVIAEKIQVLEHVLEGIDRQKLQDELRARAAQRVQAARLVTQRMGELTAAIADYRKLHLHGTHDFAITHKLLALNFAERLRLEFPLAAFLSWRLMRAGVSINPVVGQSAKLEDFGAHEAELLSSLGLLDPPTKASADAA